MATVNKFSNKKNKSDEIAIFRRLGILKSLENNILKQRIRYINKFAEGKLLIPREWSPGGGSRKGSGESSWGTCETFPWDSPVTKIQL